MAFNDWKQTVQALERVYGPATARQREIARRNDVNLPTGTPRLVAAVFLREGLGDVLLESPSGEPTQEQLTYLRDLAKDGKAKAPAKVTTRAQMDAWIAVMQARRAATALRRLKLLPGDLVTPLDGSDGEIDEVMSFGATGRVYFRGGHGAGNRPHRLRVVARAGESTSAAIKARTTAANRRAMRQRLSGPPSTARLLPLRPYEVKGGPRTADIAQFADLLDQARDERPLQGFLAKHPSMLGYLSASSYGTFVVPLPRLGSQYVPDFVLVTADSAGIHYTLVELESPRAAMSLRSGELARKAREALQQIESWREWLKDNLAYAQRPSSENGLGLPEIRPETAGLVLIGRRSQSLPMHNQRVRQRLRERQGVSIHTYDWLVESLRVDRHQLPLGPLDLKRHWEPPNPFEPISDDLDELLLNPF